LTPLIIKLIIVIKILSDSLIGNGNLRIYFLLESGTTKKRTNQKERFWTSVHLSIHLHNWTS